MSDVHQLIVGASEGDAVTEFALAIRRTLSARGSSEIYACHRDVSLLGKVCDLDELAVDESAANATLLYHLSIGQPEVVSRLETWPGRLVVYYHNVVPFHYFAPYDPYWASLLELGKLEALALRDRVDLMVANSAYSAEELHAMGYRDVPVVAPVTHPRRVLDVEPSEPTLEHLRTIGERPIILYVGQLLPQKRVDFLLDAFHIASTYLGMDATLMLAGPPRLSVYERILRRKAREFGLRDVHFAGHKTLAELAALYERASFLVTASDWESYCVPLVEGMSFGLPIVARATTAVPETLGTAGLRLPAGSGPALMAEAWSRVLDDAEVRGHLVATSEMRFKQLEAVDPVARVVELVGQLS